MKKLYRSTCVRRVALLLMYYSSSVQSFQVIQPNTNSFRFRRKGDVATQLRAAPFFDILNHLPFEDVSRQLTEALDIGGDLLKDSDQLSSGSANIPAAETSIVLESMGQDLLIFLLSSVVVTLLSNASGVSPILGYLIAGAILGPHGLDVFSNERADVELGDFGILFLLFSEGLEVSSQRLAKLKNYLPLGFAQISLTTGVITAALLAGAPQFFDRFLPLDDGFIDISNPTEAVVLALAGTLSTSAFIFPVLKERGWEGENAGQAATSILLLQDLFVAPLLVILPFVVGQGPTDYAAIAFLTAKAAIGFGFVMFVLSKVLQQIFRVVAKTQSAETFVALSLLVSVGMGAVAKSLGLTDTAGAFAAGILLANTNFRAQIQADILPFKGILLGIFFMDAGSLFDSELVLAELPTVLTGAISLILLKGITVGKSSVSIFAEDCIILSVLSHLFRVVFKIIYIAAATRVPRWMEPNRLEPYDAVKLAFLLSGGGEFAFVVLALAEKLDVLPKDLGGLLTAIVLITMAVTPLLGIAASSVSKNFSFDQLSHTFDDDSSESFVADDAIVVCGYGEVGKAVFEKLGDLKDEDTGHPPSLVAFDMSPMLMNSILMPTPSSAVMFGDSANPEVILAHGVEKPRALFVSYDE